MDQTAIATPDSLYASAMDPFTRARAQLDILRRDGFRAWQQARRLQSLCIKLANTRLKARLFPEKSKWPAEADALQAEMKQIFDGMRPLAS